MRRRSKQTPASLSLSEIASRVFIVAAVIGFFFLLVLLINHWYLHSLTKAPNTAIAPQKVAPQSSEAKPPEPSVSPSDKGVNLTFYQTLNQSSSSESPPTLSPPETENPPAAPAPPAVSSPPSPAVTGDTPAASPSVCYTVQAGSFRSREGADAIADALSAQGFVAAITPVTTPQGETWYRVRIGNYSDREEAEKVAEQLRQKGNFQPFVMSQTLPKP